MVYLDSYRAPVDGELEGNDGYASFKRMTWFTQPMWGHHGRLTATAKQHPNWLNQMMFPVTIGAVMLFFLTQPGV